jgi:hypothetical protein
MEHNSHWRDGRTDADCAENFFMLKAHAPGNAASGRAGDELDGKEQVGPSCQYSAAEEHPAAKWPCLAFHVRHTGEEATTAGTSMFQRNPASNVAITSMRQERSPLRTIWEPGGVLQELSHTAVTRQPAQSSLISDSGAQAMAAHAVPTDGCAPLSIAATENAPFPSPLPWDDWQPNIRDKPLGEGDEGLMPSEAPRAISSAKMEAMADGTGEGRGDPDDEDDELPLPGDSAPRLMQCKTINAGLLLDRYESARTHLIPLHPSSRAAMVYIYTHLICQLLCAVSVRVLWSDRMLFGCRFAAKMWVYPAGIQERAYQVSIIEKALLHNTLVCLPTGLGKTFIAAVVMYNFFRWFPEVRPGSVPMSSSLSPALFHRP